MLRANHRECKHTADPLNGSSSHEHGDVAGTTTDATSKGEDGGCQDERIATAKDVGQLAVQRLERGPAGTTQSNSVGKYNNAKTIERDVHGQKVEIDNPDVETSASEGVDDGGQGGRRDGGF